MVLPSNTTSIFLSVLEFDPRHDEIDFIRKNAKKEKRDQLLISPSSVGRFNSTRVDEGRNC